MIKEIFNDIFDLKQILLQKKSSGMYRSCPVVKKISSRLISINNKNYINFASNDYLGLSDHPKLINALHEGINLYGAGTGASALVTGFTEAHNNLSLKLSELTGKKGILLFNSGFAANQALIKAFIDLKADLVLDKLVHASMQDAASRSTNFHRFQHQNLNKAEELISKLPKAVLFTEGVFSMDGDITDIAEINKICNKYNTPLVLDDAHGFGVIGEYGKGSLFTQNLTYNNADVYMGTLSKACGLSGAFIATDEDLAAYMVNTSREYIYSTSAPAFLAHATITALDIIHDGNELREHLFNLIKIFKNEINQELIQLSNSQTSIQPIIIGDTQKMLAVANYLKEKGLWCGAIRPPTVPINTARLRITITAAHTENDIHQLTEALNEACNKIG
jgi:8-amino-7-oxononanoate synthase